MFFAAKQKVTSFLNVVKRGLVGVTKTTGKAAAGRSGRVIFAATTPRLVPAGAAAYGGARRPFAGGSARIFVPHFCRSTERPYLFCLFSWNDVGFTPSWNYMNVWWDFCSPDFFLSLRALSRRTLLLSKTVVSPRIYRTPAVLLVVGPKGDKKQHFVG